MTPEQITFQMATLDAERAFETQVHKAVPQDLAIRDSALGWVEPVHSRYAICRKLFLESISDPAAYRLLSFLSLHHWLFQADIEIFASRYKSKFVAEKADQDLWRPVEHNFPRLSQTAVGIAAGVTSTLASQKLIQMAQAGFVERKVGGRPLATYTSITSRGDQVIQNTLAVKGEILRDPIYAFHFPSPAAADTGS